MQVSVSTLQFFGWLDILSDLGGTIATAQLGLESLAVLGIIKFMIDLA